MGSSRGKRIEYTSTVSILQLKNHLPPPSQKLYSILSCEHCEPDHYLSEEGNSREIAISTPNSGWDKGWAPHRINPFYRNIICRSCETADCEKCVEWRSYLERGYGPPKKTHYLKDPKTGARGTNIFYDTVPEVMPCARKCSRFIVEDHDIERYVGFNYIREDRTPPDIKYESKPRIICRFCEQWDRNCLKCKTGAYSKADLAVGELWN